MNSIRLFIVYGVLCFAFSVISSNSAYANKKYASIVMDAETGIVLRERYADKRLHPASLTKMMTLYMTFDALERGKLTRNQRIWISPHAASMVPSKLGLKPRSTIRVEDAIYALVTKSANDIAVALGEAISGTETQFAIDMTRKARQLGMRKTVFKNASGLHHRKQVSTARDMARLSQALLKNHPRYYKYFNANTFTYRGKTYRNHNRLKNTYTGMDGIKTGYVAASGFNLAASAKRDGRRLIGVVFGGRTSKSRNAHMAQILDQGFSKAKTLRLTVASAPPLPTLKPDRLRYASLQKPGQVQQNINIAALNKKSKTLQDFQMMGLVIGEGDVDPEATKQVLSSLESMAKTNGGIRQASNTRTAPSHTTQTQNWSVQIGTFKNEASSTAALKSAAQKLPQSYVIKTQPQVVKSQSGESTIYRARFSGLTRAKAVEGCRILKDCIVLASYN